MEAGYFKKEERVIPDCPIKQTIFGITRAIRDDKSFEKLLNFYIKDIPALPGALVKSALVTDFFSLKSSDIGAVEPEQKKKKKEKTRIEVSKFSLGCLFLKSLCQWITKLRVFQLFPPFYCFFNFSLHAQIGDQSLITGPVSLKSYCTIADFMDKKTKFSFKKGSTVQVIQKDPNGRNRL